MLLKVIRENETTYYVGKHIRKFEISPVYGNDDLYDVALYVDNQSEIVKVFDSFEEAENFVKRLAEKIADKDSAEIIDLSTF